jgi:hypothetical protein
MKQVASSDSQIVPEVRWTDMQPHLLQRLREQAGLQTPGHAWLGMTDEQLLLDAGLAHPDTLTGELRFTLAALLLLGSNEALRRKLPLHGTQAVYRPGNWRRGSREEIRTNLLETHDQLMDFASRHLPDQEETRPTGETVSMRDAILSEIFAGSLSLRDYAKSYPARFVIEADRVFLENGMAPGKKDAKSSVNPLITAVFKQIGWSLKAGKTSAVDQWGKAYFGLLPLVTEGSVYRILAPIPGKAPGFPTVESSWDISEMLATQAPWTQSKAAQNEVGLTRNALDELVEGPILTDVENMQIPAPIEPLDMLGRPLHVTHATPAMHVVQSDLHASPPSENVPNTHATVALRTTLETREAPLHATPALRATPDKHATLGPVHATPAPSTNRPSIDPMPKVTFAAKATGGAGTRQDTPLVPKAPTSQPGPVSTVQGQKNHAVHQATQAERTAKILEFCKTPRYRSEMQAHVGIVNRDYFRKDILNPLIEKGLLEPTLRDKPNSPKQQYATVGR